MKKIVGTILILSLASLFVLTGCTRSEKETLTTTKDTVKSVFSDKKIIPNQKLANFSFYLPQNLNIVDKGKNNVLIKYGGQVFILFVNPKENNYSQLNYKEDKKHLGNNTIIQKIDTKDSFTYIYLKKNQSESNPSYELIISSGGNKMTTKTDMNNIVNSVDLMAKMIHSVVIHKKS